MFGALPIHRGRARVVKAIPSAYYCTDRQPDGGELIGEGRASGGGKCGFTPAMHRREGIRERRIRVCGMKDPPGVE